MTYKAREVFGYYENIVEVHVDARLKYAPYAQCGVRFDQNGAIEFVSYNTSVITIDPHGWLTCTGTYSPTTRKQIGRFLKEYAPNLCYQDAKYCYDNNCTMNIYTKEVQTRL